MVYKKEWDKKFTELTQEFSYKFGKEKENKEEKKEEEKQKKPDDKTVENFIKGVEAKAKAKGYLKPVTLMDYEGTIIRMLVSKDYKNVKIYGINNIALDKKLLYISFKLTAGANNEQMYLYRFGNAKYDYDKYKFDSIGSVGGTGALWIQDDSVREFEVDYIYNDNYWYRKPEDRKYDNIPKKYLKGNLWLEYKISLGEKQYSDGKGSYEALSSYKDGENFAKRYKRLAKGKLFNKGWYKYDITEKQSLKNIRKLK